MKEIEKIIKDKTIIRLDNDVVSELFSAYCEFGAISKTAEILAALPEKTREPIIHTLGSHVTKEKPVFVYSLLKSSGISEDKATEAAAVVDLLWCLSLMYDDMFDQDLKRSGLPSSWVKFGSDETYKSAYAGLEVVKKMSEIYFGPESPSQIDKYIGQGLTSLKVHKNLKTDVSTSILLDNYRQRALFHTALPFVLVDTKYNNDNPAFLGIENVNLAGQILNDLKDISPKYIWLREGFSDIRSGIMSVPIAILLEKLSNSDKTKMLEMFGGGQLSNIQRSTILEMFIQSGTLVDAIRLTRNIYNNSLLQFRSVLKTEFYKYIEMWIGYKLQQLDDLI